MVGIDRDAPEPNSPNFPATPGPHLATVGDPLPYLVRDRQRPPGWTPDQARTKSRFLATGSVAVVPDTAYLIPLEAPQATIRHLGELWAAHSDTATVASASLAGAARTR
jgi:hypothetical protein